MSLSAHEYPAYALQIESLPSSVRQNFLLSMRDEASIDNFSFNDIVLSIDPFLFAAHAYWHLRASGNGCGHLTALLAGEAAFISTPLY